MVFMIHPEHGATNVREGNVEEHEKNGWRVSTPAEWLKEKLEKKHDESLVFSVTPRLRKKYGNR
jgi:hypothetical protein